MNLSDLKNQAHRLGTFLKSHPETAVALAAGRQSACYETIACVHGAKDWNTLRGSVDAAATTCKTPVQGLRLSETLQTPEPDMELGSVFGGLRPGDVLFHQSKSRIGPVVTADLCAALGMGFCALVLHTDRSSIRHLALALGGVATTASRQHEAGGRLLTAQVASVDFSGWKLTQAVLGKDISAIDRNLADLLQTIELRARPGQIVLVEGLEDLQAILGSRLELLAGVLSKAARAGAMVVCVAGSQDAFGPLRQHLTATLETVHVSLENA